MAQLSIIEQSAEHDLLIFNLKRFMKEANLNETDLSRKTSIPQATVHKILSGKTEDPRASTLKTLAEFFDTSIDELLTGETSKRIKSNSTTQSVPVISWKECVNANKFISNLTAYNWGKWVVSEFFSKHGYALYSTQCMAPRFPKGTVLFIDPDATPKDGDYVVVHYTEVNDATLREYSIDGPSQLLLPINANSSPTKLTKNIKMLGVLIKSTFVY